MSNKNAQVRQPIPGVGSGMPGLQSYMPDEKSVPSLEANEIEARSLVEGISYKKLVFKDDINGFLNSLTEDEFTLYMNHLHDNNENLWDTGRENVLNVAMKGEDRAELFEQQVFAKTREEEIMRNELEAIENKSRINLDVFEPWPFNDFIQIFDIEWFDKLPLFIKLFYLKEFMQYNSLFEDKAFPMMTGLLVGMNGGYYYFMKNIYFSNKVKLLSLPRFLFLFLFSDLLYKEVMIKSYYLYTYQIDLNAILDTDELFMYEDPYYRALIKRVCTLYPHLVNDNYDFSDILEEKNEVYEKYFMHRGNVSFEPSTVMNVFNKVFAIKEDRRWFNPSVRAFEKMMQKYSSFFDKQKADFENEVLDYYLKQVSSEYVKSLVDYYDQMIQGKLDKQVLGTSPVMQLTEYEFMRELEKVVDVLDKHLEGIEINNKMPVEARIKILRQFDKYNKTLAEEDKPKVDDLLDVSLTEEDINKFKDKGRYLPQKNMSYREYLAIYKNFKAVDFERNSFLTASLPWAMVFTFLFQRIIRKL